MGLLTGKTALIFGVANDHSIAWGVAEALHREGARLAFSYAGEILQRRVMPLAAKLGSDFVEQCDVASDAQLDTLFASAAQRLGTLDILVHSVAFAPRAELSGAYYATSRAGFQTALDVSCYSFSAMVQRALPLFNPASCCLTMTYYGAEKVVPSYNVMGVAKAALESSTRYLAYDLGAHKIRVNCISAGPVQTLAARGIAGFSSMMKHYEEHAPLKRSCETSELGATGVFLASDGAASITGQVLYVDGGYEIMGM